jgi:cyclopropane-fatty-acyl-phospholipid synthase
MSTTSISTSKPLIANTLAGEVVRRIAKGLQRGRLTITLPSGTRHVLGETYAAARAIEPRAELNIRSWNFVRRVLLGWDIGLAESYMAGEWSSPDICALLRLFSANAELGVTARPLGLLRFFSRLSHRRNRNTLRGSRRNIAAHYDLGNAFYAKWLDEGLQYSSALYESADQSLEAAQEAKLRRIVELLDLSDGNRILEIGCGWGGLGERILDHSDCQWTGLTLSNEQLAYAQQRFGRFAGQGTFDVRLQDYREITGTYDRIVSIEMLEAVGEEYWPVYFETLRRSLVPGGSAIIQAITIAEEYFPAYRRHPDFIQRYIFPGGMLPTSSAIEREANRAGLSLVSAEHFASSYARTLAEWRARFHRAWPQIAPLGYDERFRKMWDYYLAYCQAGFETGALSVGLYKLKKAEDR